MKRFISFGSIAQFRNILTNIQHQARYVGVDGTGEPIYNHDKLPTLVGLATEKIHGTNAAVCYNHPDGFWVQSRKNIITAEQDNAGCAAHQLQYETEWKALIIELAKTHGVNLETHTVSVYFEWAGGSIQKNTAVSGLDKQGFIFQHFKVSATEPAIDSDGNAESAEWFETKNESGEWLGMADAKIHNIMNFPTREFTIDFDSTAKANNDLIAYVTEVIEPNSLVGQQLGVKENIGEGIVVTLEYKGSIHKFKVKGEKHSSSKVKTLKAVDEVKENAKREFANYACPAWRLEQMWDETFPEGVEPEITEMGTFLRAVMADIRKEESDILQEKALTPKDVNAMISKLAKQWFMERLNQHPDIA